MQPLLERYARVDFYDEFSDDVGVPRSHYVGLARTLRSIDWTDFQHRVATVNAVLLQRGVTFTVYADARGTERIMPFDLIPRIVPGNEWSLLRRGISQRVYALNAFLADVYGPQKILTDRVVPWELVYSSLFFCREMIGLKLPHDVYIHVSGIDLIRGRDGTYYVLEDNLRTPSGISYVLENRDVLKRSFPRLFEHYQPLPVDDYPRRLRAALTNAAPYGNVEPTIVLLTPGIYNSAYFEHTMLARRMGVELVEGHDLIVRDNIVYMKTTKGTQRVDVIYRRVDDDFIDPLVFSRRLNAGGRRLDGCLSLGERGAGQRRGHRCRRRQGGLSVRAGDDQVLFGRRSDSPQRADLRLQRRTCSGATSSGISTNSW